MRKLLTILAALVTFATSLFLAVIVSLLVRSEVLPAIEQGTFAVQTETIILNYVWKGSQIYILLGVYVLLAGIFAYAGMRLVRAVIRE